LVEVKSSTFLHAKVLRNLACVVQLFLMANPFQKPRSIAEKYQLWKQDLDRTCGNSWESVLARQFDRLELNRLNTRIKLLEKTLSIKPYQRSNARQSLAKCKGDRDLLMTQMKIDIQKAKEYQSPRIDFWKVLRTFPEKSASRESTYVGIPSILKKKNSFVRPDLANKRDSKLSFADEAIEIVFEEGTLNPISKRVTIVQFH
jgi:hypothetical protein